MFLFSLANCCKFCLQLMFLKFNSGILPQTLPEPIQAQKHSHRQYPGRCSNSEPSGLSEFLEAKTGHQRSTNGLNDILIANLAKQLKTQCCLIYF